MLKIICLIFGHPNIIDWQQQVELKQHELSTNSTSYLIINGATAHEFKDKWDELMSEHNDSQVVWSKIVCLFDLKFVLDNLT